MTKLLVGVDLGGTSIRAAVATGTAQYDRQVEAPTPATQGPDAVFDAIVAVVADATGGRRPDGLALGIPGPLDPAQGIVFAAPQLVGWTDVRVVPILEKRFGCPVVIHNDASLAGYAEWAVGAGQGTRQFIFITASSGIGGCLVLNGDLFSGGAGTAGEIGHMPVGWDAPPCNQGHVGCLEGTASGTAIARRARAAVRDGVATMLADVPPEQLDARAVDKAAVAGDRVAIRLYAEAGRALGRAIGGLINLLSPEVVVVGGGLIHSGELLFNPVFASINEMAFQVPASRCRTLVAALGTDAGLVGAVAWAVRSFGLD